jgi:hypothetical protein
MINVPRVHGNGFIQLDLTDRVRLHVWGHKDIPQQKVYTGHHDHMFGFVSRVLLGKMGNSRYRPIQDPDGRFMVHKAQVRDREDTVLRPVGERVTLIHEGTSWYGPGQTYSMKPGEIHESLVDELTVTVITKTGRTLSQGGPSPRVFVPIDMEPDNNFNRYQHPADVLWRIIAEALFGARWFDPRELESLCPTCNRRGSSCEC